MPINKYNQVINAFENLENAMSAIIDLWYKPELAAIIDESNDKYPFAESFDDELFPKVIAWRKSISENVQKNYLRIQKGGQGYVRYEILSNDFCYDLNYDYDPDYDTLDTEYIFDRYFNYMQYGTHEEEIEESYDTLEEAEEAFMKYRRMIIPISIDKENHTISGKIYFIQTSEYDWNGKYDTEGGVWDVVTGLGYYGLENE